MQLLLCEKGFCAPCKSNLLGWHLVVDVGQLFVHAAAGCIRFVDLRAKRTDSQRQFVARVNLVLRLQSTLLLGLESTGFDGEDLGSCIRSVKDGRTTV